MDISLFLIKNKYGYEKSLVSDRARDKAFTPFVAMKVGYGIGNKSASASYDGYEIKASIKPGFYIAPSVGVKYRLNKGNAISLGLIYDVMTFKASLSGFASASESTNNSAVAIRLGWEF